jgi:hypothetical protein
MQLPIILASYEQNVKGFPKKAHDAYAVMLEGSQIGQKAVYICGGVITD